MFTQPGHIVKIAAVTVLDLSFSIAASIITTMLHRQLISKDVVSLQDYS